MRSLYFLSLVAFSLFLNACTGKLEVGNIDLVNWKNDRYGCNGLRIQQLDEIQKTKNDFLGANNQELIKTFGRPDRVILVDKSQSYFYYFLEPSEQCENHDTETAPLKVMFRMNAINKVSEVNISRLDP